MKIQCITYLMGIHEARLLARLLKQHQRRIEQEYQAMPCVMADVPIEVQADYDLSIDMYNDIIKLLQHD